MRMRKCSSPERTASAEDASGEGLSFVLGAGPWELDHAPLSIFATQVGLFWVGEVKDLWGQTQVGRLESECDGEHCVKLANSQ